MKDTAITCWNFPIRRMSKDAEEWGNDEHPPFETMKGHQRIFNFGFTLALLTD